LRLYEFQAKKIFAEHGIKVPNGRVATSPVEAGKIAEELGVPVAVKAQVLMGGRGLAGGVKFSQNRDEAQELAAHILGGILKTEDVNCVLVEEKIPIETEYFAGVTIDYHRKSPVVIASSRGGVDIESIALEHPGEIVKEKINTPLGLTDFKARRIAKKIGLKGRNMRSFATILKSLYSMLLDYDATLVEVNPLALATDGSFIAVDAKIVLDDNASFRHRELFSELEAFKKIPTEGVRLRKSLAEKAEIPTYIELSGNMGIIADGAGTGMLTLDLTKDLVGDVETYCELGGRATPELIEEAMNIVLSNVNIHVLLINLIGGLNRMDEMAKGITSFLSKKKKRLARAGKPEIVVRMSGTLEEEGRKMLREAGIDSFDNIYDAIEKAVELSRRS